VLFRLPCLEQLHDARQTARDVLRLGRLARDLGDAVSGCDFVPSAPPGARRDGRMCREISLPLSPLMIDLRCSSLLSELSTIDREVARLLISSTSSFTVTSSTMSS
jgi:hypothetical protein